MRTADRQVAGNGHPAGRPPGHPDAVREPIVEEIHGHVVADPYRWLENPADPRTQDWQAAQDRLWQDHAAALPGRDRLNARISELTDTGLVTAPTWRCGRRFFLRRGAGQPRPVLCTVAPGSSSDDVLIDPSALDPDGGTAIDHWQPDREGRLLAYQVSRHGDERSHLFVMDIATGQVVDGPVDGCRYSPVAWLPGGEAFYYVRSAPEGPAPDSPGSAGPKKVYLHRVGTPADADVLILDHGADCSYGLGMSADGRWLTVSATRRSTPGNALWLADLSAAPPERPDLRVVQESGGARTVVDVGRDGRLYVVTSSGAPHGRLCVGDPAEPGEDGWTTLVGTDDTDGAPVLGDFIVLDGPEPGRPVLLVRWTRYAIGEITVHDALTGERTGEVPLPGMGSVGSLAAEPDGGHAAWFSYTDGVTPGHVLRYDTRTGETTRWADAPGVAVHPEVESRRFLCTSADGTRVPMVVLAKPTATPGPRPTILYGYGGFGLSLTPTYSAYALAWVEAGGVFVTANLRGGGEGGAQWHRDGRLDRKQNVFDDFVAAAEKLIADGWTTPAQLGACGESNGGLVVGAALTQRPDLFGAAVCSAALLDMVRYERTGLGSTWTGEYGSAADPEQFGWLLGYSPYHRVRGDVDHPAVLFTVFANDTRVDPLHARKMCAALQHASDTTDATDTTDASDGGRPVLLRTEGEVGHGGRAVDRSVGLAADMLAFLAAHTGLDLRTAGEAGTTGGSGWAAVGLRARR